MSAVVTTIFQTSFFLQTGQFISLPLFIVFDKSLQEDHFLCLRKEALVIPIRESGDHALPENYRPILLLSSCSKILERNVSDWLRANFGHRSIATKLLGFT